MKKYEWSADDRPLLFSISNNWDLPKLVADELELPLMNFEFRRFSDEEFTPRVPVSVRRSRVYLFAENTPASRLVELHFIIDALCRASVTEINLVLPYPGWLRQDRIKKPHESLSARKVYGDLDTIAKVVRFMVVHPHTPQANLTVDSPWEDLYPGEFMISRIKELPIDLMDTTVIAADFGASHQAMFYAKHLGTNLGIIDKLRLSDTDIEVKRLTVQGKLKKNLIIVDDIVSTFGTGKADIDYLLSQGNGDHRIFMIATHAKFCGPALERIASSPLEKLLVTNTVPLQLSADNKKIERVSVHLLLAGAIFQADKALGSVSSIYDNTQRK